METRSLKTAKLTAQQGDTLYRKLDSVPKGDRKIIARGRIVVAHGESGHSHVIEQEDAELIQIGERMILSLPTKTGPIHEEHHRFNLSPGIWEVGRVQEYDWLQKLQRTVID